MADLCRAVSFFVALQNDALVGLPRLTPQNAPHLGCKFVAIMILRKNDSSPALFFVGGHFFEWEHGGDGDGGYAADRAMWARVCRGYSYSVPCSAFEVLAVLQNESKYWRAVSFFAVLQNDGLD